MSPVARPPLPWSLCKLVDNVVYWHGWQAEMYELLCGSGPYGHCILLMSFYCQLGQPEHPPLRLYYIWKSHAVYYFSLSYWGSIMYIQLKGMLDTIIIVAFM